jgi:hypothetical protein
VTRERNAAAAHAAGLIGAKHKYNSKSDRWYVILDSIETALPIDGLLPLVGHGEKTKRKRIEPEKSKSFSKQGEKP